MNKRLNELSIYRDVYDLVSILIDFVSAFPKMYKYTMGGKIVNTSLELFECLLIAYKYKDKHEDRIYLFIDKFELLRVLIRLCGEKHVFTIKLLTRISILITNINEEIEKQLNN